MPGLELALFATDLAVVAEAVPAGVASVVVDWEHEGKETRQALADTEVNNHTVEDLRAARACTGANVICRVNAFGPLSAGEIERAIGAGADELLLPMVRTPEEVEAVLELVAGRSGLGILVETRDALAAADDLARLPLARVYVGLNDLAIDRGSATIFAPLGDGTLDDLRRRFAEVRFGFGGLTVPEGGHPIPCRLLVGELARLECDFTFLRRSFYRDVAGRDVSAEVPRIHAALAEAHARPGAEVDRDREELLAHVAALASEPDAVLA